ncbi:MAG: DUF4097 family beta strand repeat-containing protein [Streptosporangiaceae bacterium]
MTRWTIDSPTALDFDGVVALRVRIVGGSVAVLATDGRPRVEVAEISGQPLLVTHEAGILTISYEDLSWDGLLGWLRPQRHFANVTVAVQKDCPTQVGVVNATAVVAGMSAATSLKSVNGGMTLDGVTGPVDANTVSGNVEAQGLDGNMVFHSVSGDLTLADARVGRLDVRTVSGRVTADVELAPASEARVGTLSGDVAIRLPAGTGAKAELRSASGRLHSEFQREFERESARESGGLGSSAKRLSGTLGDGSGHLSVNTMSGNVTILRSPRPDRPGSPAGAGTETDAEGTAEETTATRTGGTTVEGDA